MKINLGKYEFHHIADLVPDNDDGIIKTYTPQEQYKGKNNLELLDEGVGEFCSFKLPNSSDVPGVYAWVVDGDVIYIGETKKLKARFNSGYGKISPRNCYKGGQKTNCKMNKVVKDYYNNNKIIKIYFLQTNEYKAIEKVLITLLTPKYNEKGNKKWI